MLAPSHVDDNAIRSFLVVRKGQDQCQAQISCMSCPDRLTDGQPFYLTSEFAVVLCCSIVSSWFSSRSVTRFNFTL